MKKRAYTVQNRVGYWVTSPAQKWSGKLKYKNDRKGKRNIFNPLKDTILPVPEHFVWDFLSHIFCPWTIHP
jgi:hypothetical protein